MKVDNKLLAVAVVLALAFYGGFINLGAPAASGGNGNTGGAGGVAPGAACPTILSQTLSITGYDADKPTTTVTTTGATVWLNAANGQPYAPGTSTKQLGSYDVKMNSSTNYFATIVKTTTDCSAAPSVVGYLKGVDSATLTAYNTNGITVNTQANNLTIGASGSGTIHLKMSQTVAYKHLTGESGKFAVFLNASNLTEWNPSQMSAVFNGVPCTAYTGALGNSATPAALTSNLLTSFLCTGDFQPNDGNIYDLAIKMQAASGVTPATNQQVGVNYVGVDYYEDSVSGKVALGAVKDTGAAIQVLRSKNVWIN